MVNTEKLAAYYKSAQEEKELAEQAAGKGKVKDSKTIATPAKEKEIEDYDIEVNRQTLQTTKKTK